MSTDPKVEEVSAALAEVQLGEDGKPLSKSQIKKLEKQKKIQEQKAARAAKKEQIRVRITFDCFFAFQVATCLRRLL